MSAAQGSKDPTTLVRCKLPNGGGTVIAPLNQCLYELGGTDDGVYDAHNHADERLLLATPKKLIDILAMAKQGGTS